MSNIILQTIKEYRYGDTKRYTKHSIYNIYKNLEIRFLTELKLMLLINLQVSIRSEAESLQGECKFL